MIYGIGIDTVNLPRMSKLFSKWGERLEQRILASEEIHNLPNNQDKRIRRIALAFAAKESFAKAMQTGLTNEVCLHEISIYRNEFGAPKYSFGNKVAKLLQQKNIKQSHLSLTDDEMNATAITILEN